MSVTQSCFFKKKFLIYVISLHLMSQFEDPFNMPDTMIHADGRVEKFEFHPSKIPYNFMNSAGLVYEALETVRCIKEGTVLISKYLIFKRGHIHKDLVLYNIYYRLKGVTNHESQ